MELRIEPLDTLFFRDGKPFSMGEETWADSHLLPSPSVIYGMLRTAIATQNGIGFDEIEDQLVKETFSIKSIYYHINGQTVLPLPLDLVAYEKEENIIKAEKEAKAYEVKPLEIVCAQKATFSSKKNALEYFVAAKNLEQVETIENGLIINTELAQYLSNQLLATKAFKVTDFVLSEPKIGISRDDMMRNADDGMLYRVDMNRVQEFQIGVSFDLANFSNPTNILRMGGEGKIVHLKSTRKPTKIVTQTIDFSNNRFKIYFATPAILLNGQPDLSKLGSNINAKLVAACVGKATSLGGFDLKKGKAKHMYQAVPAGSVFYYEAQSDLSDLNKKQGISLSDEQAEQGFGIVYFGTWKPTKA